LRLLLDTHALLWWDAGKLPASAVRIVQRATEVFVSAATVWEIAIKAALGKIKTSASTSEVARAYGFRELAITFAHAEHVRTLRRVHRDPFDRMLVAQATVERLTILTQDPQFAKYGAAVAWR
jgi:PIN domain nuclease of toxin-antitoxin system